MPLAQTYRVTPDVQSNVSAAEDLCGDRSQARAALARPYAHPAHIFDDADVPEVEWEVPGDRLAWFDSLSPEMRARYESAWSDGAREWVAAALGVLGLNNSPKPVAGPDEVYRYTDRAGSELLVIAYDDTYELTDLGLWAEAGRFVYAAVGEQLGVIPLTPR